MATTTKKGEKVADQTIDSINTAVDLSQKNGECGFGRNGQNGGNV